MVKKKSLTILPSASTNPTKLTNTQNVINENYGVCFQLYEENFQHTCLGKLKPQELKDFERLILEVIKCKNEAEFNRLHHGKNNPQKSSLLSSHELKDEIIHIGKSRTAFRLHGVLLGKVFKIISIDPKHQEHKS